MTQAITSVAMFLLEHLDLIEEIYDAIKSGAPKDAIRAAIREAKVQASDAAFREELGLEAK